MAAAAGPTCRRAQGGGPRIFTSVRLMLTMPPLTHNDSLSPKGGEKSAPRWKPAPETNNAAPFLEAAF